MSDDRNGLMAEAFFMKNNYLVNSLIITGSKFRANCRCGFTMVEILVVVLIISLMATAAGGLYMGTFKNLQLEKAAKEIYLAAKYARLAAVEKQMECRLAINKAEGVFFVTYQEIDEESDEVKNVVVSNPYTKPVTLPDGVSIEKVVIVRSVILSEAFGENGSAYKNTNNEEELENVISFSPYGTADSAMIKIGNGKTSYTVSVSPATGKVKIVRGNEAEMPLDIIDLDELEK